METAYLSVQTHGGSIINLFHRREAQRRRQISPLTPVLKNASDQALTLGSGCSSQGHTGCDHLLTASWWCPDSSLASRGTWRISLHAPNINIKELVEAKCPHPILQTLWSSMFLRVGSPRSHYLEEPLVLPTAPTNKFQTYAGRPIGNQRWRHLIRAPL